MGEAFAIFVVVCVMCGVGALVEFLETLWLAFEPVRKQNRKRRAS